MSDENLNMIGDNESQASETSDVLYEIIEVLLVNKSHI